MPRQSGIRGRQARGCLAGRRGSVAGRGHAPCARVRCMRAPLSSCRLCPPGMLLFATRRSMQQRSTPGRQGAMRLGLRIHMHRSAHKYAHAPAWRPWPLPPSQSCSSPCPCSGRQHPPPYPQSACTREVQCAGLGLRARESRVDTGVGWQGWRGRESSAPACRLLLRAARFRTGLVGYNRSVGC